MATKTTSTKKSTKKTVSSSIKSKAIQVVAPKAHEGKSVRINVLGVDGKSKGTMSLPVELFGAKVNKTLLTQAVRVYLANQREPSAAVKTRGEVEGSTRKIYRQKGTGRARHGSIRAPIFVGGGIVFGPRSHDYSLKFPVKMKKAALASALTQQFTQGSIVVVDGMERLESKTKRFAKLFTDLNAATNTLLVVPTKEVGVIRAARNLSTVDIVPPQSINTYQVLSYRTIVFTKDAVELLKDVFIKTKV